MAMLFYYKNGIKQLMSRYIFWEDMVMKNIRNVLVFLCCTVICLTDKTSRSPATRDDKDVYLWIYAGLFSTGIVTAGSRMRKWISNIQVLFSLLMRQ